MELLVFSLVADEAIDALSRAAWGTPGDDGTIMVDAVRVRSGQSIEFTLS